MAEDTNKPSDETSVLDLQGDEGAEVEAHGNCISVLSVTDSPKPGPSL